MMSNKSRVRKIQASDSEMDLVDRGWEIDNAMKGMAKEDRGIKEALRESVMDRFGSDSSVSLQGKVASAKISRVEKFQLDTDVETMVKLSKMAEDGHLGGAVKREVNLSVPPRDRERASQILQDAGITASISTELSVVPDGYRAFCESGSLTIEMAQAKEVLVSAVKVKETYRVGYDDRG
jgi:hypothetical protein